MFVKGTGGRTPSLVCLTWQWPIWQAGVNLWCCVVVGWLSGSVRLDLSLKAVVVTLRQAVSLCRDEVVEGQALTLLLVHPRSPQVTPYCLRSPLVTVHRHMTDLRRLAIKHQLRVAGHARSPQVTACHWQSPAINIADHQGLTQGNLGSARLTLSAI